MAAHTDEDLARRMQDEEIASYTQATGLSETEAAQINPLLNRLGGRNRVVQRNALADLSEARNSSFRLLILYLVWAVTEMIISGVVLAQEWDKECDKPLKWWLLGFSGRYVLLLPISYGLYRAHEPAETEWLNKLKSWATLAVFVWFVVGQTWVYSANTCQNTARPLYLVCLVLVIMFYIALACPIIFFIGVCLFFPCILLFHRYLTPSPAASPDMVRTLPTRVYPGQTVARTSASDENENEEDVCSICMEAYKQGDSLKGLPCKHEFHVQCIERWLALKDACPLCRAKINSGPGGGSSSNGIVNSDDERRPFANMV